MKKSLKKQAVFPVLMLLVVTALALIGSSFAWFSMASTASVTVIEGTVEDAGLGLMISQDATNFYSSVTMGDDAQTYVRPATFRQVSTTNGVNFFDAEIVAKAANGTATSIKTSTNETVYTSGGRMFGKYYDNSTPNPVLQNMTISNAQYVLAADGTTRSSKGAAGASANEASYMVFDLFFQAENAGNLYLDYGTALSSTKNSKAAMRVAFLSFATTSTGSDAIAATSVSSTTIWEPYATVESETKVLTYGVTTATAEAFAPYESVSGKTSTQTTYVSDELFNATTAWNTDTNIPNDSNIHKIATLANGVTKVRVVVWLEGNDPDCISAIASDTLQLTLKFFAKKTSA